MEARTHDKAFTCQFKLPMAPTGVHIISFRYTNWRGETADRRVVPKTIQFGTTYWHPHHPQWFLLALDLEKGEDRLFAMRDMMEIRKGDA